MSGLPHHIDLTVCDLESSVEFYEAVLTELGFQRTGSYGGSAPCWMQVRARDPVFSIALKAARDRTPHNRYAPGLHHLAFSADSREAVDEFHLFLLGRGFKVFDPPAEYDYTPGYYAVFFADPDRIKLEVVYEPRQDLPSQ